MNEENDKGSALIKTPSPAIEMLGGVPLGEIARQDPQLAHAFIRPDLLGWGEPSCGWGWQIINITGLFTASAADQVVEGQLNGIVEADLWVRKVTYTVRRPNAFAGSIFKGQSDEFNKLNPNIDFTMTVKSYCRYVISDTPTPLENIEQVFECVCPIGFVLGCSSQILVSFVNNRALGDGTSNTPNENPTEAVVSLHTVRLPTRYDSCSLEQAIKALTDRGLLSENYGAKE